jgi:Flp pilus assembly protein TadD
MSILGAATASAEALPRDAQARVDQAAEQVCKALAARGEARLDALRRALRLNPYSLKARYWLGASLLQARQTAAARKALNDAARWAPDFVPPKFYRAVVAIQETKKGDLEEAETLLKSLEKEMPSSLSLTLGRLELALRRKKNRPPVADWLAWMDRIPLAVNRVPMVADKCAKFFMEREETEGNQVLAWLQSTWLKRFPNAPLLNVLPYLHHIKYWPKDRWVAELQEQIFDEVGGDLVSLFILERTREGPDGKDLSEEKWLEELRPLLHQLPGVSNLAYNCLNLINSVAKKRLLAEGDVDGAVKLWREAAALDRFNTWIRFNVALVEARQGRAKQYYDQWRQALWLAYWHWELSGDRQEWNLCVARAQATADKLRGEIEDGLREKQDVPPAKILAWLNYVDLYALLRQLTFEHPYHWLGVRADALADEARRVAQVWQSTLTNWETRRAGGAHVHADLIKFARDRIQKAITSSRTPPSDSELAAFQDYCKQRADHARGMFFILANLVGLNRFEDARGLMDRLAALPLTTLEPYLAEMKVNSDEGEIPLSNLINAKELAGRTVSYAVRHAEFLAEEGDDQELVRQIGQIGSLPWAQLDNPEESRRKVRERMAFAIVDASAFEAIHDDRWTDAFPSIEAALNRLPDQLDLLWLAALALFRSVEDSFDPAAESVRWSEIRVKLQKASGYCQRVAQAAPADEVKARMGDLPEAINNALKMATEMESPRGQAVRRARALMKEDKWGQAYQALSQVPAKDRNAEAEFYLGLCTYRETESLLESGKKRPSLSDLQSRLDKAAGHLRSARQQATEDELKEAIKNLADAVDGMLGQVKRAQVRESAESLMNGERWNEAYNKLSALSKPDAGVLFHMAVCRFRGVLQEFEQATAYNRPSTPDAINRLQKALDHVRDAKRICDDDDLSKTLDNLEDAIRKNLNILKTM